MYLTSNEYSEITGRLEAEATKQRIKLASMLLDARIGNYIHNSDGWKLDLTTLENFKSNAVKQWVAYMIAYLFDNNDEAPVSSSVTLGRFSAGMGSERKQAVLPEQLNFADSVLISSGLVIRGVDVK